MSEGYCSIHGHDSKYVYIKSVGAKLCAGCLKAGFYIDSIWAEAREAYPNLFNPTPEVKSE